MCRVGQNHIYIYGVYTVFFGGEITKYTVIYGAYIRFWPTLSIYMSMCVSIPTDRRYGQHQTTICRACVHVYV